ncbi:neuropeptide receptor npr-1-like [Argiope bruennichi]|uniref:Orexin receptor type 1 like protein n=1 Tax=Argiope bruennichi TaxID=94029 RepID=A0A8T0F926_ARGBR|nr:neuropeptide receptor npr-1-like [Argiope bruennichi]KAF8785503.1 Orexin receptor type 1 like protein [Argiope bruennichi]
MVLKEIPDRYLGMIIHFLMNFHNDTSEFRRPHLRKSFKNSYKFFLFMYGILTVAGFISNLLLLRKLFIRRHYKISMYKYLAFNALNDVVKCVVVLPLALSTTLIQNWVYGSFFCYLFPMLQDIPFHATMLTFLLTAFDRYRQTVYPLKQPVPVFLSMVGVWTATVFAVLPYAVYTRYLDLEIYFGAQFKGTGICAINVDDNIEEYIRGLFIIMYVLPLGLLAFLHIKTSEEIKSRQMAYTVSFHDVSLPRSHENDSVRSLRPNIIQDENPRPATLAVPDEFPIACQRFDSPQERVLHFSTDTINSDEKDWALEKQMQSFLATAVTTYAICLLPLNLVRLLKHVVYETYENSFHFDISFITVVWLAFVPTVSTPVIFLLWQHSGVHQSSISRYLRLGRSSDVSGSVYNIEKKNSFVEKPANESNTI